MENKLGNLDLYIEIHTKTKIIRLDQIKYLKIEPNIHGTLHGCFGADKITEEEKDGKKDK